ncbi:MAG TPA: pilus assembly PilX N-terminal domain-containing protein, partial [Tepidisphaeraceae bacterium]|nr:pilus assembly PilX N-terminal domain-containing protein [Tepidisphaeraceae bacterium]
MPHHVTHIRRGAVAILAMLYLTLFSILTVAMYAMASLNVQTAANLSDAEQARAAAETGLRWMEYRFLAMSRPKTRIGNITPAVADSLWPAIRTALINDLTSMLNPAERTLYYDGSSQLRTSPIALDNGKARFVVTIAQNPSDQRYLIVTSTGIYESAKRSVSMQFRIDKKVKFAIVGKVPIQVGRNTLVEGPVAMTTAGKYPPVYMLSDFRHLTPSLSRRIDAFNNFLQAEHAGYDNRISTSNTAEAEEANARGYQDTNSDGYIDEYDLFLDEFDRDSAGQPGHAAISREEFTDPATGKLYDPDLFDAIDSLNGPQYAGDPVRSGYRDGIIDGRDGYAKVRGQVSVATTASAWNSKAASSGSTIQDQIGGPVVTESATVAPVKFGVNMSDIFDLSPSNFDTSGFRDLTGPENGTTSKTSTVIENAVLSASDANGGTATERTPYGSTSYQATYRRPVFRNKTFRNCRIPKGLNALFDNCTFEGVTYVELETNITDSSGRTTTDPNVAMTWAQKMKSGNFAKSTVLTAPNSWGYVRGNNLRFNDCVVEGPIASDVPSAYSHFANSMEFTGATLFDNKVDQTATLVLPQTNIEMGSFTDPSQAPSTLVGVVVAGNIDIRGTSVVDGSIIVTGDGAGSTTQGWFGPSDDSTDPTSPMPEGGWGKLNIRYNPYRALPDGINLAIDILPDPDTY